MKPCNTDLLGVSSVSRAVPGREDLALCPGWQVLAGTGRLPSRDGTGRRAAPPSGPGDGEDSRGAGGVAAETPALSSFRWDVAHSQAHPERDR